MKGKYKANRTQAITWALRVILGAVFLFSGFTKCIDLWGNAYKVSDYFTAWGISSTWEITLLFAAALGIFEFTLGFIILLGMFRRCSLWLAGALMAVMTTVTIVVYITDPVADCGCFGDALKISNGATLLKNIVIDGMLVGLMLTNGKTKDLVKPSLQWLPATLAGLYALALNVIGYNIQPLIDWRGFGVGTDMASLQIEPVNLEGLTFIYAKNGVEKEFQADNLPDEDDGWEFVKRIDHTSGQTDLITITDSEGDDVTPDILTSQGNVLLLIVTEPGKYGHTRAQLANEIHQATLGSDSTEFYAIIPSDFPGGAEAWQKYAHAYYPVYTADETDLKVLARGNAALVYLSGGVIRWKENMAIIPPDFGRKLNADQDLLNEHQPIEESHLLSCLSLALLILTLLIILAPRLGKPKRKNYLITRQN